MAKFDVIVADPPWSFSDKLTMSQVKRGAESQYDVLTTQGLKNLDVESIASEGSMLALWVPSSLLQDGLDVMEAWGFEQKQTFVWVKTKKELLSSLVGDLSSYLRGLKKFKTNNGDVPYKAVVEIIQEWDVHNVLNFGMGRLFRNTHEIALIGKRGKVYDNLKNKSQRSVLFDMNLKHSAKPEGLQDRLDLMFPLGNKLELFARRERAGWTCVGNECQSSIGGVMAMNEDIRDSIKRLKKVNADINANVIA